MIEQGVTATPVIISAVGAFGGGALVGALANHMLRVRTERKQERQERKSLLFLVIIEILSNDTTARRWARPLQKDEEQGVPPKAKPPKLRTAVWDAARTRLAYLVPAEDFYRVIRYYNSILRWRTKSQEETLNYFRKGVYPRTEKAVEVIVNKYLAEEMAKGFIQEYEEELRRFVQLAASPESQKSTVRPGPSETSW